MILQLIKIDLIFSYLYQLLTETDNSQFRYPCFWIWQGLWSMHGEKIESLQLLTQDLEERKLPRAEKAVKAEDKRARWTEKEINMEWSERKTLSWQTLPELCERESGEIWVRVSRERELLWSLTFTSVTLHPLSSDPTCHFSHLAAL